MNRITQYLTDWPDGTPVPAVTPPNMHQRVAAAQVDRIAPSGKTWHETQETVRTEGLGRMPDGTIEFVGVELMWWRDSAGHRPYVTLELGNQQTKLLKAPEPIELYGPGALRALAEGLLNLANDPTAQTMMAAAAPPESDPEGNNDDAAPDPATTSRLSIVPNYGTPPKPTNDDDDEGDDSDDDTPDLEGETARLDRQRREYLVERIIRFGVQFRAELAVLVETTQAANAQRQADAIRTLEAAAAKVVDDLDLPDGDGWKAGK